MFLNKLMRSDKKFKMKEDCKEARWRELPKLRRNALIVLAQFALSLDLYMSTMFIQIS